MSALRRTIPLFLRAPCPQQQIPCASRYLVLPLSQRLLRPFSSSPSSPSGHSKWSTIKHKKADTDAARANQTHKLIKSITTAGKLVPQGTDSEHNVRMNTALAAARAFGVPKEKIEYARKKSLGLLVDDKPMHSRNFEVAMPGGKIVLLIETESDNPNRANLKVNACLKKAGASIAKTAYLFERKGVITVSSVSTSSGQKSLSFDDVFDAALEAEAEDVRVSESDDGEKVFEIITPTNLLASIASTLSSPPLSLPILSFELAYVPTSPLAVVQEPGADDEALANGTAIAREEAEKYAELCTMLEAEDEVAKVWGNVEG